MSKSQIGIVLGLWVGLISSSITAGFAQGTKIFHIEVPQKVTLNADPLSPPDNKVQIREVEATVSVASDAAVTFTITDPDDLVPWIAPALEPEMGAVDHTFATPAGAMAGDFVIITPSNSPVGDPNRNRYTINLSLHSNYDLACKGTQIPDPDIFTITVSADSPNITGVCLKSIDGWNRGPDTVNCSAVWFPYNVPLDEEVATVQEFPAPTQGCFKERPPVDAMLVLDKSGSMGWATATPGATRIQALRDAVEDFVIVWDSLRTNEGTPPPGDRIGVVLFDLDASWWTGVGLADGLNVFGDTVKTAITDNVHLITPGGWTSIGDGLKLADEEFTSSPAVDSRKAVLLMSDGAQNRDWWVTTDSSGQVATYQTDPAVPSCTLSDPCTLTNQPQIYAVTVGTGMDVDALTNQGIANASGGFYINTEDDATLLRPFFLELLQNFLRFNSYQTVRMISKNVSATTPFSASVPLSTTSRDVSFSLMWPKNLGSLRLTLTPPGGGTPIVEQSTSGLININRILPMPAPFDPTGSWDLLVELISEGSTNEGDVPFHLYVIADDSAIKADMSVVAADYAVGDNIRLRAKLTRFGLPIRGLKWNPGNKIVAELIEPGVSVGDILSDSKASPDPPPSSPDIPAGARAKLFNTRRENASVFVRNSRTVRLYDDGKARHGDDVKDDGIYSALYPAQVAGHYNFLFTVESSAKKAGQFTRQQLRTAYVRPVPDADKTIFRTTRRRNQLSIVMKPRTKFGARMGPGWANYFWFKAPGKPAFKAKDNLDGTYTATLDFTGSNPPLVSAHFLNVLMVIGDSVTPDRLPVSLGPGTMLVPNVRKKKWWQCFEPSKPANAFLFLGGGVFLLGFGVYRPSRRRKLKMNYGGGKVCCYHRCRGSSRASIRDSCGSRRCWQR